MSSCSTQKLSEALVNVVLFFAVMWFTNIRSQENTAIITSSAIFKSFIHGKDSKIAGIAQVKQK